MPQSINKESASPPEEDLDTTRRDVVLTEVNEDEQSDLPLGLKPVKISDDQREELTKLICNEIDAILTKRIDLGLEEEWQSNQDQYDGILPEKEFPSEHSSNFNVPITADKVDTLFAQTEKAMFFSKPIIGIEPAPFEGHEEEKGIDVEISEKKEEFLDFVMTNEVPVKEGTELGRFQACLHGTGWVCVPWVFKTEPQYDEEIYEGAKDLDKFVKNYPTPPDEWGEAKYKNYLKRLIMNETIRFEVEYNSVIHNGPLPRSVDIFDFIIDPMTKNIKASRFHGERMTMSGDEIIENVENEFFIKDTLETLFTDPKFTPSQNKEFEEIFNNKEFEVYRIEFMHSFKAKMQSKRYLAFVLYEKETNRKLLLQIFNYPWWHNQWDYLPIYIAPKRRKGIYRDGLAMMLRDPQLLANISHDIMVDCAIAQVIPTWRARKAAKKQVAGELSKGHYAGVVYWLDNPESDLIPNEVGGRNLNFMPAIQANAERMADLRSGMTSGLSGRELPQDPGAPGNKTIALLSQSNIRIGPFLDRMQESLMRELAYQIIQLYYQFKPSGVSFKSVDGVSAFPKLSRDELRRREHYTPMGTAEILDDQLQDQKDQLLLKLSLEHPDIQQRPKTRIFLLEEMIKHLGIRYRRKLRKILPSEEELRKEQLDLARQAVQEHAQQAQKDQADQAEMMKIKVRTQQLLSQGMTPEQAKAVVSQEFNIKTNPVVMPNA